MFCCKIFILPVLIRKDSFPPVTDEFNSKQLSVETNLFRTDSHSVESRKCKQLKVNQKKKVDQRSNRFMYENNKTYNTEKKHNCHS
jgi:hypothetical protein